MEVSESEWVSKCIDNMDQYLNRGGPGKGDEPQLLGGTELINNIGFAMGLPIVDPSRWTKYQLELALKGSLCYYEGDSLKAIEVIVKRIVELCDGDSSNYVTILPIEMYYKGKLYELPLFRVHRQKSSHRYFVDNIGRSYDSFNDWFNNNKLPPCEMLYPAGGALQFRPGFSYTHCYKDDTPSNRTSTKVVRGVDIGASVVGIGAAVGSMIVTGGVAGLFFVGAGVASAVYGTARTTSHLVDRGTHGESINPFTNSESRLLWLGIAANIVSFGAMGATMRLGSLVAKGKHISDVFRMVVNVTNGTNLAVSGLATLNSVIFMIDNWKDMSDVDVLFQVMSIAFWTKGAFTYKTAGTLIKEFQAAALKSFSNSLPADYPEIIASGNVEQNRQALRFIYEGSKKGMEPTQAFDILSKVPLGKTEVTNSGDLIINGHLVPLDFVASLPKHAVAHVFQTLGGLSVDQRQSFHEMRMHISNDAALFGFIHRYGAQNGLTPQQATDVFLQAWEHWSRMPQGSRPALQLTNDGMVLGHGHRFSMQQLHELPAPARTFVFRQLATLNADQSATWNQIRNSIVQSGTVSDVQLVSWMAAQGGTAMGLPAVVTHMLDFWFGCHSTASSSPAQSLFSFPLATLS